MSGNAGHLRIWDSLRGCWLSLTPEEWVRQNLIKFLCADCGASGMLVKQECPVQVHGTPQRADVVVHDRAGNPLLLAECKSSDVGITAAAFDQVVRYNAFLGARYIVVTNGLVHFIRELAADGTYSVLTQFPDLRPDPPADDAAGPAINHSDDSA